MNKLIIMCGVIGSGKSTWIKNYLKTHPYTLVVSKDDIRRMLHGGEYIYDEGLEDSIDWLETHIVYELIPYFGDVIIDECNLTKYSRSWNLSIKKTIVYFPPKDKEYHINRRMTNSYGVKRKVWEQVYDEMIHKLESPTKEECDELIIIEDDNYD